MRTLPIATWIIIACWIIFILFWIISAFGVKHDVHSSPWRRFAWLRIVIFAVILSLLWKNKSLGSLTRHWGLLLAVPANPALAAIGAGLCVLGTALAIWARVHLGRNWSAAPALKEGHELITSGPYRKVRHPIYTGIIISALGTGLIIPLWIILFIIVSAMFIWRIKIEEKIMTNQFPNQYPEYKKQSWALIPYIW